MAANQESLEEHLAEHYIHRSNWLRASVLGANDGILSTASIALGVASANEERGAIVLASLAGLVAGALSMSAGEYVSVSSQTDIEQADIERERKELEDYPEEELARLTEIYELRGLKHETAALVAEELTENNALEAHVRDELGLNEALKANPLQAAAASGLSFTLGGLLPFFVCLFLPVNSLKYTLFGFSIFFLGMLGAVAANTGGSSVSKAVWRITILGTITMGLTALVGYIFGVNV